MTLATNIDDEQPDNPLVWPVLETLRNIGGRWKVHTLASYLDEQGYMPDLDVSADKALFKRNFLLMNALYQLQEDLYPDSYVQVQAMDICLMDPGESESVAIEADDPLRSYYTDWQNYQADEEEVRRLLNEFWQRYRNHHGGTGESYSRQEALKLFGLSSSATQHEIRKRWRRLALKWHPDRDAGDADKFRRYCAAWSVLRA